jgi:hypothetical protein
MVAQCSRPGTIAYHLQRSGQAAAAQPGEHRVDADGLDAVGIALAVGVVVEGDVRRVTRAPSRVSASMRSTVGS